MYSIYQRKNIDAPFLIWALIMIFSALDVVRMALDFNLGRYPMWLKLLYIRTLVYVSGYTYGDDETAYARMNRKARRSMYFRLPKRVRGMYVDLIGPRALPNPAGGKTLRSSRSGLFYEQTPGGLPVITDVGRFSGNVFFCDSGTAQGGTTSGFGTHPDKAFTDIESAIDSPMFADQGDVCFMLEGHAETLTDEITVDLAGISLIGLGKGLARPTFTQGFAGDAFAMDADSTVLDNVYFNEATVAPGAGGAAVDVNASHVEVLNCHFDLGSDDLEAITVTTNATHCEISGNEFVITADGPDAGIEIEATGATHLYVHDNMFHGLSDAAGWDLGAISSTVAHTSCRIFRNEFLYGPAIIFSAAATGNISFNIMGEGTLGSMLDPGSCMAFENYEADAVDQSGRLIPTGVAS